VRVRAATAADVDAVAALRLALLREEAAHPLFTRPRKDAPAVVRRLTAAQLVDERQVTLVALVGARAIGVLRCVGARGSALAHPPRFALVTTVYVRPAYRRRGVLRALVGAADAWARGRGLTEMRLHCGIGNAVGQAAWAALGFTPVEVLHRRRLPRDD
jgi:GNAT superfamily N-acetyltransferase